MTILLFLSFSLARGCGSWTWYYPYLYAPLASDFVNLAELDIEFEVQYCALLPQTS